MFKTKKVDDGIYEVVGTNLTIERGGKPKFRMPQEWFVMKKGYPYPLCTANAKASCLEYLEILKGELTA